MARPWRPRPWGTARSIRGGCRPGRKYSRPTHRWDGVVGAPQLAFVEARHLPTGFGRFGHGPRAARGACPPLRIVGAMLCLVVPVPHRGRTSAADPEKNTDVTAIPSWPPCPSRARPGAGRGRHNWATSPSRPRPSGKAVDASVLPGSSAPADSPPGDPHPPTLGSVYVTRGLRLPSETPSLLRERPSHLGETGVFSSISFFSLLPSWR